MGGRDFRSPFGRVVPGGRGCLQGLSGAPDAWCVRTRGEKTQGPFRHLYRISMRTKHYKLENNFFLRYLQNMVYFYVEKKSYEGSCYFERKFIKSP